MGGGPRPERCPFPGCQLRPEPVVFSENTSEGACYHSAMGRAPCFSLLGAREGAGFLRACLPELCSRRQREGSRRLPKRPQALGGDRRPAGTGEHVSS